MSDYWTKHYAKAAKDKKKRRDAKAAQAQAQLAEEPVINDVPVPAPVNDVPVPAPVNDPMATLLAAVNAQTAQINNLVQLNQNMNARLEQLENARAEEVTVQQEHRQRVKTEFGYERAHRVEERANKKSKQ
jgi:hypothetical protein